MPEPQPAAQQINLPMVNIADFCFNFQSFIAVDVSGYKEGQDDRMIIVHLVGPTTHFFVEERADKAWLWYLNLTGQARIQT